MILTLLIFLFLSFYAASVAIVIWLFLKVIDWETAEQRRMTWKEFFKGVWA